VTGVQTCALPISLQAAEAAIANPLLDETSMKGARGVLISISGGKDLTLFEVDEAATRIREEVDPDANIILGATFDDSLEGVVRVSVVATGIDQEVKAEMTQQDARMADLAARLRAAGRPVPAALEQARVDIRTSTATATAQSAAAAAIARSLDIEDVIAPAQAPAPAPMVETRVEPIAEPAAPLTRVAQDPAVAIQRVEPQPASFAHTDPVQ
jgi:cell division protein FtsZ